MMHLLRHSPRQVRHNPARMHRESYDPLLAVFCVYELRETYYSHFAGLIAAHSWSDEMCADRGEVDNLFVPAS